MPTTAGPEDSQKVDSGSGSEASTQVSLVIAPAALEMRIAPPSRSTRVRPPGITT